MSAIAGAEGDVIGSDRDVDVPDGERVGAEGVRQRVYGISDKASGGKGAVDDLAALPG